MKRVAVVAAVVGVVGVVALAAIVPRFLVNVGSSSSGQVNLGGSCSESSGALKWSQIGAVVVCKGGKYKYAIPSDFPATQAGGYKSRPSWYPTIT